MKPIRTAIYGACHASALESVLKADPELVRRLEFTPIPSCMDIDDASAEAVADAMGNLDLFIYQPISADYRGVKASSAYFLERAGPHTRFISFAYYHFELYTPYLLPPSPLFAPSAFQYTDYLLAASIAGGLDDRRIVETLLNFDGLEGYAPMMASTALNELRVRDTRVLDGDRPMDIRIADHIEQAYRATCLGHTINHPSAPLFRWLADEVTERIGDLFGLDLAASARLTDPLDGIRFPIAPYIRQAFDLTFEERPSLTLGTREITLQAYVADRRAYYEAIPWEVMSSVIEGLAVTRPWYEPLLSSECGFGVAHPARRIRDAEIRCYGGVKPAALAEGWSDPEEFSTWSDGPSAAIVVEAPEAGGGDLTIQLFAMGYVPPGLAGQSIAVSAAGEVLARWVVRPDAWHRYSVVVPARLFRPGEPLRLELSIPDAASPGDDPRRLGVGVQTLSIFH